MRLNLSYKNIPLALKSLLIIFFIVSYSIMRTEDPSISALMNCWKTLIYSAVGLQRISSFKLMGQNIPLFPVDPLMAANGSKKADFAVSQNTPGCTSSCFEYCPHEGVSPDERIQSK